MPIGEVLAVGLIGLQAATIQIQTFISSGLPHFSIIGLPDTALNEARERVRAACQAAQLRWPQTRITVNLSPASMPKRGSAYDMSIAASILSASGIIPHACLANTIVLGELNLDGSVLPVQGLLPMLLHAERQGISQLVLPRGNQAEAQLVKGLSITYISHIKDLVTNFSKHTSAAHRRKQQNPIAADENRANAAHDSAATKSAATSSAAIGNTASTAHAQRTDRAAASTHTPTQEPTLAPSSIDWETAHAQTAHLAAAQPRQLDMADVIGQEYCKWALQVAAAGGHHLLMVGPPGSGKTMLAARMASILPQLTDEQQLEVASIRSLCGTLQQYGISAEPPYEAPHHTATVASLVGGGSQIAQPGAMTKAHLGILFLDEAPEFTSQCLQALREPLESGFITLSRARAITAYPAQFQLLMAANPCPCGYAYGTGERCICRERDRMRYFAKLSGPILDRIDIQLEVPPLSSAAMQAHTAQSTSSASMRRSVQQARDAALERFQHVPWRYNAQTPGTWLREHTASAALAVVRKALDMQQLSLRGADRVLRLAWTLADLRGGISPRADDVMQSIMLRTRIQS